MSSIIATVGGDINDDLAGRRHYTAVPTDMLKQGWPIMWSIFGMDSTIATTSYDTNQVHYVHMVVYFWYGQRHRHCWR
jgi:hypothetical protein